MTSTETMQRKRSGLRAGLAWIAVISIVLTFCPSAQAGTRAGTNTYKFTNMEDEKAHDLHIEFKASVEWDINDATYGWQILAATFKSCNGSGSTTVDLATGVGGTGVAKGAAVELTFGYPGGEIPQVKKWWWTNAEGKLLGPKKYPKVKKTDFEYISAAGGGELEAVTCGLTPYTFTTSAAESAEDSATRLVAEIVGAFPTAAVNVDEEDPTAVVFQGTCYGDPAEEGDVSLVSDDTACGGQDCCICIKGLLLVDVPTVSEWGLMVMTLLVLTAGTVVLGRRRRAAAA